MKILASLPALGLTADTNRNGLETALQAKFDEQYVPGYGIKISIQEYVTGKLNRQFVVNKAIHWNTQIKAHFLEALKYVIPNDKPLSEVTTSDVNMSDENTAYLETAAFALADDWDRLSPYGVFYAWDDGRTKVSTHLNELILKDVKTNPENYAIITVATTVI